MPLNGGSDHEPSYCHCGMWPHPRRVLDVDAEPGFLPVGPGRREVLRIESEPPGADARTAEGQSCRTPCELTVPATGEVAISFALQGYNPQTISVRAEAPAGGKLCRGQSGAAAAQSGLCGADAVGDRRARRRTAPPKKKSPPRSRPRPRQRTRIAVPRRHRRRSDPASAYPSNYPWPPPPPPQ